MKQLKRCPWVDLNDALYVHYHDEEWGRPIHNDTKLFEMLTLEGAQAGLSWQTVLKKRAHYRKVFAGFDPKKVARFTQAKQEKLMQDPGIIRNRLKIASTVTNAQAVLKIQEQWGSLDAYLWRYVDGTPIRHRFKQLSDYPAKTPLSTQISKDLKKAGFRFVGETIVYAFMQAVGMVDDHSVDCWVRLEADQGWSVYIVQCRDKSLYTGIAKDVDKRFGQHQAQGKLGAKYLRGKGPLKLVFQQAIGSKSKALQVEHALKNLTKEQKLNLIRTQDIPKSICLR